MGNRRVLILVIAVALAGLTDVGIYGWDGLLRAVAESRLVINASSLGLDGTPLGWDPGWLQADHRVFDMVYRREPTPVVTWACNRGTLAVDGLAMLFHQGAEAFRHWFGEPVPETGIYEVIHDREHRASHEVVMHGQDLFPACRVLGGRRSGRRGVAAAFA